MDIEEPVKKNWFVLFFGILILIFMSGLGVFLLLEAFKKPLDPTDVLDMKRMLISGIGVFLFSLAVVFFLWSLYKPSSKKKIKTVSPIKPVVKKGAKKYSKKRGR